MIIAKITACVILCTMAATWATISINLGVMVAVGDNFIYLGGLLLSVITGGDFLSKFSVKK